MKGIIELIFVAIISGAIGVVLSGLLLLAKQKKAAAICLAIFLSIPILNFARVWIHDTNELEQFHKDVAYVHELCEKYGGDKIYKTVDNVEGVFQMKARNPDGEYQWQDQYGMVDPYGEAQGDHIDDFIYFQGNLEPIKGYLFIEKQQGYGLPEGSPYQRVYIQLTGDKFVNLNPNYSQFYDKNEPALTIVKSKVEKLRSRYGYLTEDISTKEMRSRWIAGGKIKIIDLQTNEVLAERTGFFRAEGLFSKMHWASSAAYQNNRICPNNSRLIDFLHKILKPIINPSEEQIKSIGEK